MINPVSLKRSWVDPDDETISIRRQCELQGLNRSTFYCQPGMLNEKEMQLMRMIDEISTRCPFYGSRKITAQLNRDQSHQHWNRKRIQRLMRIMGIQGVAPGPHTSQPHPEHQVYPYFLDKLVLTMGATIKNHHVSL